MKHIHVDLTLEPRNALSQLSEELEMALHDEYVREGEHHVTLAEDDIRALKLKGLLGEPEQYETAHFSMDDPRLELLAVERIAKSLAISTHHREGIIDIPALRVCIASDAKICHAADQRLIGKDAFHYLACCIEQDVALVKDEDAKLTYAADISRFEKTPKDPVTGRNGRVGCDLLALHANAPTYGDILPGIFYKIVSCMNQEQLDLLTIDLNGQKEYVYEGRLVRRKETDALVPLMGDDGLAGILATADVSFVEVISHRQIRLLEQPPLKVFHYGLM